MIRARKINYLLILILLLASILRFYKLGQIPIGFNDDEAAFGYNAYSILKTGLDEWERFMPFPVFESFGDWKLVFYLYQTVISQAIFGLNVFATRAPSALFGVFAVLATYLLASKLFNKTTAFYAAIILAISPWHVIASRNAFESDLLVFMITMGTFFLLKALDQNKKFLIPSLILFTAAFYTYRSSWLFLPLFVMSLLFLLRKKLNKLKSSLYLAFIALLILLIPLYPVVLTFRGQSRFIQESFLSGVSRTGIINDVNQNRGECSKSLPIFVCILLYNKYAAFSKTYISNYFGNLSYASFFDRANPTGFQSFSSRSAFNIFELPFFLLGLIYLIKKKHPALKVILPWILLAPIGASFAGIGNYGRINLIMPAPQLITAFGIVSLFLIVKKKQKYFLLISLLIVALISTIKLYSDMFFVEPYYNSRYQRYGYKQFFDFLRSQQADYDNFYVSRNIDNSHQYIQYLYFNKVSPSFFLANVEREKDKNGWVIVRRIGNYHFVQFVQSDPVIRTLPKKSLLAVGEKEISTKVKPRQEISDIRKDIIFQIFDVKLLQIEQEQNKKTTNE